LAAELLYPLPLSVRAPMVGGPIERREESMMSKVWAALLIVASLLLVAPILESGTAGNTQYFQAVGTADGGGI
jgi:hypothetical protein